MGEGILLMLAALVSMDNITHCLQVHMNVLLFVYNVKLMIYVFRDHFQVRHEHIFPSYVQIYLLQLIKGRFYYPSVFLDLMKNIYWQISQRKMTIFSIILIPDFIKREHILEQYLFILDSQNISPLQKVEFSPTNEIGSEYPCVFWYLRLYRECVYLPAK